MKAVIILAHVLSEVATRIFKNHPDLDEVFLTSDGQGFKEINKACSHASNLKDQEVKRFERHPLRPLKEEPEDELELELEPEPEDEPEAELEPEPEAELDSDGDDVDYRAGLEAKYEELYGKKPVANMKDETLEKRIAEKS